MQQLSEVPLLISSDFERGLGMRLKDAPEFPYNMAVAAAGDLNLAYQIGKFTAVEARALGVHQNYAPVSDINNNAENPIINIRSFSEDKYIVSNFTSSYITGLIEGGIISTAKHFPGHGNTKIDSHQEMPSINIDRYNLANNELVPFIRAIHSGVQSIMVGHLDVPSLEYKPRTPASLSKAIISGLLRNEMSFDGLIVTDALNMEAVTKYYSDADAAVKAVEAGNDILLMPPDAETALNAVQEAVESGKINVERINESVRRILSAKKWLQLDKERFSSIDNITKIVGKKSHLRLVEEIAEKSITLVKNDQNIIPIDPKKIYRTASISVSDGKLEDEDKVFENFVDDNFGYVNKINLDGKSSENKYERALKSAEKSDLILLSSYINVKPNKGTVELSEEHKNFIKNILSIDKPVVLISFGNPYLLSLFPEVPAYLCSYGFPEASQLAMGKAVIGKINISGKLPISIPNTPYRIGDGINLEKNILTELNNEEDVNYNFNSIDTLMSKAVEEKDFPGGVLLIGKGGKVIYKRSFGRFTFDENSEKISDETLFDLDAVTKPIAASAAAMILYDEGKILPEDKVLKFLPEYKNVFTDKLTVKDLFSEKSNLENFKNIITPNQSSINLISTLLNDPKNFDDLKSIMLQKIIEKASGKNLDVFLKEKIFEPLKMQNTMFNPPKELLYYCAPSDKETSAARNKGTVYNKNAYLLGGIAGNAGLFSTSDNIAVFLQMIIQKGSYAGKQIIKSSTIEKWMSEGLGWNTKKIFSSSKERKADSNLLGQTGETGTAVWIDKERKLFVILLTNASYADGNVNKTFAMLPKLNNQIIKTVDY